MGSEMPCILATALGSCQGGPKGLSLSERYPKTCGHRQASHAFVRGNGGDHGPKTAPTFRGVPSLLNDLRKVDNRRICDTTAFCSTFSRFAFSA